MLAVGLWGTFGVVGDTPAPYTLALITNFILLGLTGTYCTVLLFHGMYVVVLTKK